MDKQVEEEGKLFWTSILFLAIICGLPFLIDFIGKLLLSLGGSIAQQFFIQNLWLEGVLGYLPVYFITLFYLKTTFNPLAVYGYVWKKEYFGWAVYLGIGSGIIIYLVDRFAGNVHIQAFSFGAFLGYLAGWVILPALLEETLFRGVIQRYYQKHLTKTFTQWNISVGVLIASAAEVLFHLAVPVYFGLAQGAGGAAAVSTLPQLLYVAVFGFIGGAIYQRTGSLVAPITIHALGNVTELILLWLLH